jgi:hypothetical protein
MKARVEKGKGLAGPRIPRLVLEVTGHEIASILVALTQALRGEGDMIFADAFCEVVIHKTPD